MLDKERLRRWLISEHDYKGEGAAPAHRGHPYRLASHYWELTGQLTGEAFSAAPTEMATERVKTLTKFDF